MLETGSGMWKWWADCLAGELTQTMYLIEWAGLEDSAAQSIFPLEILLAERPRVVSLETLLAERPRAVSLKNYPGRSVLHIQWNTHNTRLLLLFVCKVCACN